MDTGQRLGLVLLYVVMAGNAVLMLRLFIQIFFRAAIERHRRRQFADRNGGAAYTLKRFDGKRGWANRWLPRNPEINQPAQNGNSAGKLAGAGPIVKQAIALVSIVIAFGLAWTVAAQQGTGREVTASTLKQQLFDLESKETRLRMRLEELDEQLKPESIERELAGIGSTRPEELREHRRKLLTIERNGLQTQLDLLEEDRDANRSGNCRRRNRSKSGIRATFTKSAPGYSTCEADHRNDLVKRFEDRRIAASKTLCRGRDVGSAWQRIHLASDRCNTEGPAVDRFYEEWKQRFPNQS